MARITKSLLKKVVGEEYLHRDHRSKKGKRRLTDDRELPFYKKEKEKVRFKDLTEEPSQSPYSNY